MIKDNSILAIDALSCYRHMHFINTEIISSVSKFGQNEGIFITEIKIDTNKINNDLRAILKILVELETKTPHFLLLNKIGGIELYYNTIIKQLIDDLNKFIVDIYKATHTGIDHIVANDIVYHLPRLDSIWTNAISFIKSVEEDSRRQTEKDIAQRVKDEFGSQDNMDNIQEEKK